MKIDKTKFEKYLILMNEYRKIDQERSEKYEELLNLKEEIIPQGYSVFINEKGFYNWIITKETVGFKIKTKNI